MPAIFYGDFRNLTCVHLPKCQVFVSVGNIISRLLYIISHLSRKSSSSWSSWLIEESMSMTTSLEQNYEHMLHHVVINRYILYISRHRSKLCRGEMRMKYFRLGQMELCWRHFTKYCSYNSTLRAHEMFPHSHYCKIKIFSNHHYFNTHTLCSIIR